MVGDDEINYLPRMGSPNMIPCSGSVALFYIIIKDDCAEIEAARSGLPEAIRRKILALIEKSFGLNEYFSSKTTLTCIIRQVFLMSEMMTNKFLN